MKSIPEPTNSPTIFKVEATVDNAITIVTLVVHTISERFGFQSSNFKCCNHRFHFRVGSCAFDKEVSP